MIKFKLAAKRRSSKEIKIVIKLNGITKIPHRPTKIRKTGRLVK